METKYKVGDRVKIKDSLRDMLGQRTSLNTYINNSMAPHIGKITTIRKTNVAGYMCYHLDDTGDWVWDDTMLEPVDTPIIKPRKKLKSKIRF